MIKGIQYSLWCSTLVVHTRVGKHVAKMLQTVNVNIGLLRIDVRWYRDGKADVMYNEEAVHLATDIAILVLDISTNRLGDP